MTIITTTTTIITLIILIIIIILIITITKALSGFLEDRASAGALLSCSGGEPELLLHGRSCGSNCQLSEFRTARLLESCIEGLDNEDVRLNSKPCEARRSKVTPL